MVQDFFGLSFENQFRGNPPPPPLPLTIRGWSRTGSKTEVNRRIRWDEKSSKEDFDLATDGSNGFGSSDRGVKLRFVDIPFCDIYFGCKILKGWIDSPPPNFD